MKCNNCNSTKSYLKKVKSSYNIKNKTIEVMTDKRFCSICNNLIKDDDLESKGKELATIKYNKEYGITKEEIIDLRHSYNLSQELFSKVIGCAKKTLVSYEKGKSIPNDTYMIILKSLLARRELIFILIEVNDIEFTLEEINSIKSKNLELYNKYKPVTVSLEKPLHEYNGYTKINKNKIKNIIIYLSSEGVLKTKLLKEMFYIDFINYKRTCSSLTGLEYAKLPFGPVPNNYEYILNELVNNHVIDYNISFNNDYECHVIKANKTFDKNIFRKEELDLLNEIKNKFKDFTSKEIVNYSHKENAFLKTSFGEKISYDYSFDIHI